MTVSPTDGSKVSDTNGVKPQRPACPARLQVAKRVKLRCLVGGAWPCGPTGGA